MLEERKTKMLAPSLAQSGPSLAQSGPSRRPRDPKQLNRKRVKSKQSVLWNACAHKAPNDDYDAFLQDLVCPTANV